MFMEYYKSVMTLDNTHRYQTLILAIMFTADSGYGDGKHGSQVNLSANGI